MKNKIEFGVEARKKLQEGVNKVGNAVVCTLGPFGRNVIFEENGEIKSTKDGVSVAKKINKFDDPIETMGAQLIKQASIKTADKAGDGTTTSTLLAQTMINQGLKALNNGCNASELKKGMTDASYEIIENLYKISSKINSEEQLEQVATVSANNDIEIGKLISTSLNKVGREGIVTIEESRTGETYLETVEGMQFDRGYKSPHLVTNTSNMSSVLENPNILIYDKKITQAKELLPILEWTSQQNSSLLIIAEDIDGEALATLIVNKMRGILKICAVKAPDFGERRALILEDIAILTGGTVVSQDKGMKLDKFQSEWFGKCRIAHITKENTTLIDGSGDQSKIESHILDLQSQIDNSKSPYEIEKFQERLAKMVGGVSIIHVGGNTETEMREKKDRVDDALHAAKAAIEEGIVPGGGVALIRAYQNLKSLPTSNLSDYQIGKKIVYDSCYAPFYTIMTNAGYSPSYIYDVANKIKSKKDYWMGFDLKSNLLVNLKNKGIIDPTKVTRNALSNAVSVAGTLLLTETVITEEKPESQSQGMNLMEGMY